jgi:hypothetical protein
MIGSIYAKEQHFPSARVHFCRKTAGESWGCCREVVGRVGIRGGSCRSPFRSGHLVLERRIHIFTTVVLVLATILLLYRVYEFGQDRFFTMDEYQFGHATWLVSQGQKPYVDFYEHHFPLSYVLPAVFLLDDAGDASFETLALRLRKIVFVYILGVCLLAGLATRAATGKLHVALLSAFLPITIGFGLMSAVDYRADTLAAFTFLSCLFLLELNRSRRSRALAISCGVMVALAAFMTQKMAAMGGVTIALMYGFDIVRRRIWRTRSEATPFVRFPVAFAVPAGLVVALVVGGAMCLGMLSDAYEITILQAFQHEALYPDEFVWEYLEPFLSATWYSSLPIVGFAVFFCFTRSAGFWRFPLAVAIGAGVLLRAQYPYNYVFLSYLIGVCAVRGYAVAVERIPVRGPKWLAARPLLYLVPLAVIPNQLDFVSHTTTNVHQLAVLNRIQAYTSPGDAVIDNAGGAMFRSHGSYYYHHGAFHRQIFADYFATELVEDYRRSQAIFWIKDMRLRKLPEPVREYFESHYLRVDGDLHGLGFSIPAHRGQMRDFVVEVVREGYYHILSPSVRHSGSQGREYLPPGNDVWIDGRRVRSRGLRLGEGSHRISLRDGSPFFLLSFLPPEAYTTRGSSEDGGGPHHTMLFEYREGK